MSSTDPRQLPRVVPASREPGEPDNVWWFGFDTGHGFDYAPGLWARVGAYYSPESQALAADMRAEIDRPSDDPLAMRYRDFDYVRRQTAQLARQLAERARPVFIGVDHAAIRAGAKPRNSAEARYLLQLHDEELTRARDDER